MNTPSWPSSIPAGASSERLGRYELMFKIASGGMATVHLARMRGQGDFERLFAIKRMHPHLREIPELTRDLLHEASIAGRIRHPNVVPVLDAIDDGTETFLVMEYVEGDSLSGLMRRLGVAGEKMPVPIALRIFDEMLAGLQTAHELAGADGKPLGIVHRDVSPQNVLVGVDGITRLTDFGIAKATSRPTLTATGFTKGKVAYMAPEQARGKTLDARADIWSAGVVLWEMLAGERLYREGDDVAIALVLVTENPRRLRSVRPDVSPEIEDAIHSALQREVDDRCATVAELRDRLRAALRDQTPMAGNAEVAACLNRHAGSAIAKRRAQIEEARKVEPDDTAPLVVAAGAESETSTMVAGGTLPLARTVSVVEEQVSSSNVTVLARPLHKQPVWLAAAAALVLGTIGVVAVVGLRSTTDHGANAQASPPIAAPASAANESADAAPASEAPTIASASTVASAGAASGAASTSKKPRGTTAPPKPGRRLMPNPYQDPP